MSLGKEICRLRTAKGISQSELAEIVEVSRQSVSKWETDAALPEIEKLLALSRYFGVSIEQLLGAEQTEPHAQEPPQEMTEQQLRMVEEIVEKYISALPQPEPRRRKTLRRIVLAAAGCILFVGLWRLSGRIGELNRQYSAMQYSVSSINRDVEMQIGGVSARIEEILKAQNALTAEYGVELLSADPAAGTVTFRAFAVPKTYSDGMTAEFIVEDGGVFLRFPCEMGEHFRFSADLPVPLTDQINISVVFADGADQVTQVLESYTDLLTATLPHLRIEDNSLKWHQEGVGEALGQPISYEQPEFWAFSQTEYWETSKWLKPAAIVDERVGFFVDRQLIAWGEPCAQPDTFQGDWGEGNFYRFPALSFSGRVGDELCLAALITDEYGRTILSYGYVYRLEKEGLSLSSGGFQSLTDLSGWTLE